MGELAPLSLADMVSYFTIFDITSPTVRETMVYHLKLLDIAFLNARHTKAAAADKKPIVEVTEAS